MRRRRLPRAWVERWPVALLAVGIACGDSEVPLRQAATSKPDAAASDGGNDGGASSDGSAPDADADADADAASGDPCGLCRGVTCPQPEDWCDGDLARSYVGDGACDPSTGLCVFEHVERKVLCEETACSQGQCIGDGEDAGYANCEMRVRAANEIGDPVPGCVPPDPHCEGAVAVRYSLQQWSCENVWPVTCTFPEDKENCSLLTGFRCKDGQCIECESDGDCTASERCDMRGRCVPKPPCAASTE